MNTISVPRHARVFIVEDDPARINWFRDKLGSRIVGVEWVPEAAIEFFSHVDIGMIDLFFLDHDLGGPFLPPYTTDVAKHMWGLDPDVGKRVIIHSHNPAGAKNLEDILPGSTRMPFGTFDIEDSK